MASRLVFMWIVIASLAIILVAQYGRQIRDESDDQASDAGPMLVFKRSSGAIGSTVGLLLDGARRTVEYLSDMTRWAFVALGLAGLGFAHILVGLLQLDPVAWIYTGVAIVSSMELFGVGIISNPVMALGVVAVLALAAFAIRWYAFSVLADD